MKKLLLPIILLLIIQTAPAVIISEIMYDLDGKDDKREWIEIYNNEDEEIDLTGWKFYEAETNHRLTLKQGSATLKSGDYAIIADNSDTFLSDNPDYSEALFDSTFSLSNKGETLTLRDSDKIDVNSISYSSSDAKGDGDSLQLVDEEWCAGKPTPGEDNLCEDEVEYEEIEEELIEEIKHGDSQEEIIELEQSEEFTDSSKLVTEPVKEPDLAELATSHQPEKPEPKITSATIYTSESSSNTNLAIYLLLAVSIVLNVIFLLNSIVSRRE